MISRPTTRGSPSVDAPERYPDGLCIGRDAVKSLLARLPLVDHLLVLDLDDSFQIEIGPMPGLRRLELRERWNQALVVSAPNIVRLETPIDPGSLTESAPVPPLRDVIIRHIRSTSFLAELEPRLKWLTPSSLRYLALPMESTSAAFLLPFLRTHIPRWPYLREVRLSGRPDGPRWAQADWDALEALGKEHRFLVTGPAPLPSAA